MTFDVYIIKIWKYRPILTFFFFFYIVAGEYDINVSYIMYQSPTLCLILVSFYIFLYLSAREGGGNIFLGYYLASYFKGNVFFK